MKILRMLCVALPLLCIACASKPLVYKPSDVTGKPTGELKSLSELLPDSTPVRLIFMHGVGDHCPLYALDKRNGWLNKDNAQAMGMFAVSNEIPEPHFIKVGVYMVGVKDGRSQVSFARKDYRLMLPGRAEIKVEAIEITWSYLTQWIKSDQLGYDSPSIFASPDRPDCPQGISEKLLPSVQAPWRVPLNKTIKELVFDRNLADAVLYAGTYRETIERGVAEALCHAVTDTENTAKCAWPSAPDSARSTYKNIFVTHSLGSRITYDMFIDLMSKAQGKKIFEENYRNQARPFIEHMLDNTPAFYMMANQLALLGLANVPPDIQSDTGMQKPFSVPLQPAISPTGTDKPAESPLQPAVIESEPAGVPESPITQSQPYVFGNVLLKIAAIKDQIAKDTHKPASSLEIISFNDTNDLLTWHVPRGYVSTEADAMGRPVVNVTDVFVQNSPRWLFLLEGPTGAHVDYFNNPTVRDIIRCGVKARKQLCAK